MQEAVVWRGLPGWIRGPRGFADGSGGSAGDCAARLADSAAAVCPAENMNEPTPRHPDGQNNMVRYPVAKAQWKGYEFFCIRYHEALQAPDALEV